jgi:hypothetical protein
MSNQQRLDALVQAATTWRGGLTPPSWLRLREGESLYLAKEGIDLLELHDTRPPLMGGDSEFVVSRSDALAGVPATARSIWIQESVPSRDTGWLVVTNQRVEFIGSDFRRVWPLADLTDLTHDASAPETWFCSTNHKRISGFRSPGQSAAELRFAVAVALAEERGTRAALAASLKAQAVGSSKTVVAKALGVARLVYTGKPGARPAFRATQGVAAGLLTVALLSTAMSGGSGEKVNTSSTRPNTASATSTGTSTSEADQVAATEAKAKAERDAAAQAADAKKAADAKLAAQRAATAKAAASKAAASKAAASKAAAAKAAAAKAAAEKAAAEKQAADLAAQEAAQQQASNDCHPDYLTCIPVKGTGSGRGEANDLDCPDIGQSVQLRQIGVDPYRLDADDDGIGCE